jgi:DEAD/DEAH box helicase domain-containing protein
MKYQVESMEHPPPFLGASSFGPCGCNNLLAFAKPTSAQYSTQPLNINEITIVKQMKHAEARPEGCVESNNEKHDESMKKNSVAVAGCGIVTVKRSVHGYKKLSHVNRTELSRTTISVPPMEFDTRACWIDADAAYLRDVVVNFDGGIHALSHAMIAVAPLFISCSSSDIDCDHSRYATTQILLYDQRAGGSGTTAQLYNFLADALRAAVELLEDCTSCYSSNVYDGGCPACLQSVSCDNFHDGLSRNAGIVVGKHLLKRLENSTLNKRLDDSINRSNNELQYSIKPTNIVIGRASWSPGNKQSRWAEVDDVKYPTLSLASQS